MRILLTAAAMVIAGTISSFAGEWKQDAAGWRYDNGDGTQTANCWQWIDGDQDGVAECYYFDANGYCITNDITPDGSWVNENGAWVYRGVVQKKVTGSKKEASYSLDDLVGYGEAERLSIEIAKENDSTVKIAYYGSNSAFSHVEWSGRGTFDPASGTVTHGVFSGRNVEYNHDGSENKAVSACENLPGARICVRGNSLIVDSDDGSSMTYDWMSGKQGILSDVWENESVSSAKSYLDLSSDYEKIHLYGYQDAYVATDASYSDCGSYYELPVEVTYYEDPLRYDDDRDSFAGTTVSTAIRFLDSAKINCYGETYPVRDFLEEFKGSYPNCLFISSFGGNGYIMTANWMDAG